MRRPTDKPLMLLFALAYLALGLAVFVPGMFSVDDSQYLMMGQSLLQGGFRVRNGFEVAPSRELAFYLPGTGVPARFPAGGLYTAYPPLYAFLAAPFAAVFGLPGYFYLNLAAGALALVILFGYALWLRGSRRFAWSAVLIFSLATFFFEYTIGLWPHALSVALCLAGVATAHRSLAAGNRLGLLGAGFLLGTGVGVRLIVIFAGAALLLVMAHRRRWKEAALLGAGLVPPLAAFSAINRLRLGTWDLFSYLPADPASPWIVAAPRMLAAGAAGLALLAAAPRLRRPSPRAFAAALAVLAVLAIVPLRAFRTAARIRQPVRMAIAQLVDYGLAADRLGPGAGLTQGGDVSYYRTVKKGLLQSCPFLVLALLALAVPAGLPVGGGAPTFPGAARPPVARSDPRALEIPAAVLGFWMLTLGLGFHGGLSFNSRYLLEALPFAVLLALASIEGIRVRGREWGWAALAGALAAVFLLSTARDSVVREIIVRALPLFLAAGLAALWWACRRRPRSGSLERALALAAALSLVWGGVVHFTVDLPAALRLRSRNARIAADVGRAVEPDALVFGWGGVKDGLAPLKIDRPDLVIADLAIDGGRDMRFVADRFLALGRPVWVIDRGWRVGALEKFRGHYDLAAVDTPSVRLVRMEKQRGDAGLHVP